ncbi:conserved hypothetical protein [Neospora caninum Liverpool]|uniref:SRR1 protein n=1 Tax=Neospora caninum (strain Liverpool) TaxID=572307 RepID=F0VQR9_NEOCL|nr:conserved hypothetical protein [Neospora caninum Liverpool]CBZ56066.1 conserved hypothetical protein [Neospora caninum Liverpool]CEL70814.1 TPA: SRR1 protein [Neospora caninum Liverpool]|eukprot:XP_003886092.1 conserved hypothetical protein [Neospora caninum Liverpool]
MEDPERWTYVRGRRGRASRHPDDESVSLPGGTIAARSACEDGAAGLPAAFSPAKGGQCGEAVPGTAGGERRARDRRRRPGRRSEMHPEEVEAAVQEKILECAREVEASEFWSRCRDALGRATRYLRGGTSENETCAPPRPCGGRFSLASSLSVSASSLSSSAASELSVTSASLPAVSCPGVFPPLSSPSSPPSQGVSETHGASGSACIGTREHKTSVVGEESFEEKDKIDSVASRLRGACTLICLGLGSPTECSDTASCRYQLALALLIQKALGVSPSRSFVADPAMNATDFALLKNIGFSPQPVTPGLVLPRGLTTLAFPCPCRAATAAARSASPAFASATSPSSVAPLRSPPTCRSACVPSDSSPVSPAPSLSSAARPSVGDPSSPLALSSPGALNDDFFVFLLPHCDADLYGSVLSEFFCLSPFCASCRGPGCLACRRCMQRCLGASREESVIAQNDTAATGETLPRDAQRENTEARDKQHATGHKPVRDLREDGQWGQRDGEESELAGNPREDGAAAEDEGRRKVQRLGQANLRSRAQSFLLLGNAFSSYAMRRLRFEPFAFSPVAPLEKDGPCEEAGTQAKEGVSPASSSSSSTSSSALSWPSAGSALLSPLRPAHVVFYLRDRLRESPLDGAAFPTYPRAFNDLAVMHADLEKFPSSCSAFWETVERDRSRAALESEKPKQRKAKRRPKCETPQDGLPHLRC